MNLLNPSILVHLLAAYALGSIPFAQVLSQRSKGVDLRRVGSGNVGAANLYRIAGAGPALAVVILDILKGFVAVSLAERLGAGHLVPAAGMAAIIGHMYPVWLGFHGGKGVATSFGVFAALVPEIAIIALGVFAVVVAATRYVSLGSVVASMVVPPLSYVTSAPTPVQWATLAASILIIYRHRSNLARLYAGTERQLGERL